MSDLSTFREHARDAAAAKLEATGLPIDDWSIQPDAPLIHPEPGDGAEGVWVTVELWVSHSEIDAHADAGCSCGENCDRQPGDPCPADGPLPLDVGEVPRIHRPEETMPETLSPTTPSLRERALSQHRETQAAYERHQATLAEEERSQARAGLRSDLKRWLGVTLDDAAEIEVSTDDPHRRRAVTASTVIDGIRFCYYLDRLSFYAQLPCPTCGGWASTQSDIQGLGYLGDLLARWETSPRPCYECREKEAEGPLPEEAARAAGSGPSAAERLADLIREIAAVEARYYAAESDE